MSKHEQVLNLDPEIELRFKGPFTDVVTSDLKLSNPSERKVCFKVKTTAPKRYCVRPNSGMIDPGQTVNVSVMLQPFDYDPQEKNKHKFMVQTMFAPEGPIESQDQMWREAAPDSLMDSKLKCVFEMPVENAHLEQTVTSKPVSEEKPKPAKQVQIEATPPTKSSSVESDLRKKDEEIQRMRAEQERLRDENRSLKESEVRLRKVAMDSTVSSTPASTKSTEETSQSLVSNMPPIVYLIVVFIIGLLIGKIVL
ncbi:hypothetical protein FSP39_014051 [Pinctada imbricata]|uniref:MSP domain-containing protein n=1 Tax=Pinctada imbricata TaxID=66713 RepID=A0AA88XIT8_PINIB|nr:hypothetical protein FSP39_014051 [Pinctada imbricata]